MMLNYESAEVYVENFVSLSIWGDVTVLGRIDAFTRHASTIVVRDAIIGYYLVSYECDAFGCDGMSHSIE
ncbi:hypothetical protein [Rubritalea tangerina]|uniref:hypothetical protein n=1 Tax=Rubritalea tangerina TaxID=430798 RepID=UPI0036064AC4